MYQFGTFLQKTAEQKQLPIIFNSLIINDLQLICKNLIFGILIAYTKTGSPFAVLAMQ
jgi:hypothetical protein